MRIVGAVIVALWIGFCAGDASVAWAVSDEFTVTATLRTDTASPTTPTPITATPIAATQIDVTWGASTDDVVLGGYQVFRDAVQVATTSRSVTTYEDTGLTPSTTYSYYVTAFDVSGKFSSSSAVVSTTTFDVPPPPPVATTSTSTRDSTVGGVRTPQLRDSTVKPGVRSATVDFRVSTPVRFELRFRELQNQSNGLIAGSEVFRNRHTVVLSDLQPNTSYHYELFGTDRFGRAVRLIEDTFTTLPTFQISVPVNVSNLTGSALGNSVFLEWQYPANELITNVRIVRNHLFYPTDPTNGYVVYEGDGTSFFDRGAFAEHGRQYYTVFAYNSDDVSSSGAVVQVDKITAGAVIDEEVVPGVVVADPEPPQELTDPSASLPLLRFSDISIIQNGELVPPVEGQLTATTGSPFLVHIPERLIPAAVRTPMIIMTHPLESTERYSYLLERDSDGTYYEAFVPALTEAGPYPMRFVGYNRLLDVVQETDGVLMMRAPAETEQVIENENPFLVGGSYALVWGLLGLFIGTCLWWCLLLLLRLFRRSHS